MFTSFLLAKNISRGMASGAGTGITGITRAKV
jgi:hypothetical protein